MAHAETHHTGPRFLAILAQPFLAIGGFLVSVANASAQAQAVDRLNAMSDAELAAMNTTRLAEIDKMFRRHMLA